jgi:ABC-type methionine transport system permease subunit
MLPLALILGIAAGYFKGWIDDVIQYVYTTLTSIPGVLLIAACVLMMQVYIDTHPGLFPTAAQRADLRLFLLCMILGLTGWAGLCRLLRAEALKLRELEYVQAARAFGISNWRIMARHLLPNVMHIVLITVVLEFSGLVLYEAVLSYLGIGVDPSMNSFGSMIEKSRFEMSRDPMIWWNLLAAFVFMLALVLAANLFADAVRDAMAAAGISDPADVHYVQVKCPLLTAERIAASQAPTVCEDTYESMGYSRGASALGVALALGEIKAAEEEAVCADWSLYSGVASTSAGIELMRNEIMVLGNSAAWSGDLAIAHRVMQDSIDAPALWAALADLGLDGKGQLDAASRDRLVAVLAKAEPARTGAIRGKRHTMWDDSDINATRHARALVGGVLAGAVGDTQLFVSGGAEHQGPDGGGPVAAIVRV